MRERRGCVRSVEPLTDDVLAIDVGTIEPSTLRFAPGQFVSLRINDGPPTKRRSFSIASDAARSDGFTLVVKPVGGSPTSRFLAGLGPGRELRFYGPMGYFLLDPVHAGDVVFVATGVGMSAIWPMLHEVTSRTERGRVVLFWGLRSERDVFWDTRLRALARDVSRFSFDVLLSSRGDGYVTPRVLDAAARLDRPVFYVCGHGAMIDDVVAGLEQLGIDRRTQIRTEIFYAAPRRLRDDGASPMMGG